jgi:galactokinase
MSTAARFARDLREGRHDNALGAVYDDVADARSRFAGLVERFGDAAFATGAGPAAAGPSASGTGTADVPIQLFSAPGRTELGGNHTDHNAGRVLAASVDLDTVAAVRARRDSFIRIVSQGFAEAIEVDLARLDDVPAERGTPAALVRGVAAFLKETGRSVGGFEARVESRVQPGSGLSSSASFEVLVGTVLSFLYNDGTLSPVEIARAGQHAENAFFGKPCGLMDQIACAAGGVVEIDFGDEEEPRVERMPVTLREHGYALYAVNTGESHVDLTDDYAAVVSEMRAVAEALGAHRLREVRYERFRARVAELREAVGDRAVLRGLHFYWENERVLRQSRMLTDGDIDGFLAEVRESGSSSWRLLQNCYPPETPGRQGIALALALTEEYLSRSDLFPHPPRLEGAARVHGGGFAGAIQAYVPVSRAARYRLTMNEAFGPNAVTELALRSVGACLITRSDLTD